MQAILHVGTEKTGTTTLQEFLSRNTAFLEKNKLSYPDLGLGNNHRAISVVAFDQHHYDDFTQRFRLDGERRRQVLAKNIKKKLQEIIATKKVDAVILSSEHFQSRLRSDAELDSLKNFLEDIGFDSFKVIVYLREQVAIANSLYSTWIINGGNTIDSPPLPTEGGKCGEYFNWICDHERTIKRFANTFGLASITPCLFDPSTLQNGCIVEDFLKHLSVSIDTSCFFPILANESATEECLLLVKEINSLIPLYLEGKVNLARRDLAQRIRSCCVSGSKFQMSDDLALKYQDHYSKGNGWIRQAFFPARKQLFDDPTVHQLQESGNYRQIASLIASLWIREYGPNRIMATPKSLIKSGLRLCGRLLN